jgi:hypothetical protein
MTCLALAVHPRRAVLASDSLVVDAITRQPLGHGSKLLALPHLRGVLAMSGNARLSRALALVPACADDIRDFVEHLPPILQALDAQALAEHRGGAWFVAGVVGHGEAAEVVAFALRSCDGWQPLLLAPGKVFTLGATLEDTPEPGAREVIESDHTTLGEPPAHAAAAPTAEHSMSWLELSRMPEKLVQLARSERPDTVGGPVQSVLLTCEAAFFAWDDRDP